MATTHHGITFDRVLDAVDDVGLDPNGGEEIDAKLENALSTDGTLVEFPSGRYKAGTGFEIYDTFRVGMRAKGDATIFAGAINNEYRFEGGDDHLIEGFTFDDTDSVEGYIAFIDDVETHGEFRNIDLVGLRPGDKVLTNSNGQGLNRIHLQQSSGVYNVKNVHCTGPSVQPKYPDGSSYIFSGVDMRGTLNIEDCTFANSSSHAMYCTQAPGVINVRRCTFRNNNGWQIRAATDGGLVEDCTVVLDADNPHPDSRFPDGDFPSMNSGIWCVRQHDPWEMSGMTYRNIDIHVKSTPDRHNVFEAVRHDGAAGHATFENVNVHIEEDQNEVSAFDLIGWSQLARKPPSLPTPETTLVGCTVTGETAPTTEGIIDIEGRRVTVDGCCINVTGDRPGIRIDGAGDRWSRMDHGEVDVASETSITTGGARYVEENGSLSGASNIVTGSSCTGDDGGGGGGGNGGTTGTTVDITNDGSGRTTYSITISGSLTDTSGLGAGDDVTDNGDGTVTLDGFVNGGTDSFTYTGCVMFASFSGVKPILTRDGSSVSKEGFVECQPAEQSRTNPAIVAAAAAIGAAVVVKWLKNRQQN